MLNVEILFNLANFAYLIGTILLTKRIIRNRNALKDFDSYGSMINTIGITINIIALIGLNYYITVIVLLPTLIFWGIVSIYSFRNRK